MSGATRPLRRLLDENAAQRKRADDLAYTARQAELLAMRLEAQRDELAAALREVEYDADTRDTTRNGSPTISRATLTKVRAALAKLDGGK